jgi:hypothetical protein
MTPSRPKRGTLYTVANAARGLLVTSAIEVRDDVLLKPRSSVVVDQ